MSRRPCGRRLAPARIQRRRLIAGLPSAHEYGLKEAMIRRLRLV